MRLCVISHKVLYENDGRYYTDGGFPRQMGALCKLFGEVVICAPVRRGRKLQGVDDLTTKGLKVYPLPDIPVATIVNKLVFFLTIPWLAWHIWKAISLADIIQIRIPNYVGLLGILLVRLRRKAVFIWLGGDWPRRIIVDGGGIQRRIVAKALEFLIPLLTHGLVTFTPDPNAIRHFRRFARLFPVVNTSLWASEITRFPERRVQSDKVPLHLLFVGRMVNEKGVSYLLRALVELNGFKWRLTLVGDGPERQKLEALTSSLDINGQVHFVGRISREEISGFYKEADILIIPSLSEMSPKVVLEAMGYGVAVIGTRVGAIPHLLDRDRGIIVQARSFNEIAAAIQLLVHNIKLYNDICNRAREFACQNTLDELNRYMHGVLQQHLGIKVKWEMAST